MALSHSLSLSMSLSHSRVVMSSLSSPLGSGPGHCVVSRWEENLPRSHVYHSSAEELLSEVSVNRDYPSHFLVDQRVRGHSPASHSAPLFLLLLSRGASEIFQSFKELFFAERLACVVRDENLLVHSCRSRWNRRCWGSDCRDWRTSSWIYSQITKIKNKIVSKSVIIPSVTSLGFLLSYLQYLNF